MSPTTDSLATDEDLILGPSRWLPPGSLLTLVSVPRFSSVLIGASTDRADFYHQASVTEARAATNCITPALSLDDFAGLQALASLRSGVSLEPRPVPSGAAEPCCFYAAFGTLFQGDHGGVEYATSGHQDLLREQGLLRDCDRLLGQHAVPNTSCYEALVIDDFFSVSIEPAAPYLSCPKSKLPQLLLQAESTQRVLRAQAAYDRESFAGSPAKDLLGALTYQLA